MPKLPSAPPPPSPAVRRGLQTFISDADEAPPPPGPASVTGVEHGDLDAPPLPRSIAETGLTTSFLTGLTLKHLYSDADSSGLDVAHSMRLPWRGVVEPILDSLVEDQLIELHGGRGFGRASVSFSLTTRGREEAHVALARSTTSAPRRCPSSSTRRRCRRRPSAPSR